MKIYLTCISFLWITQYCIQSPNYGLYNVHNKIYLYFYFNLLNFNDFVILKEWLENTSICYKTVNTSASIHYWRTSEAHTKRFKKNVTPTNNGYFSSSLTNKYETRCTHNARLIGTNIYRLLCYWLNQL